MYLRRAVLPVILALFCNVSIAQRKPVTTKATQPAPTISVEVDATDAPRKIFHSRIVIPVTGPGPLTVYYPKWIPGEHAPSGPITDAMGLKFRANGRDLFWRRDPLDMFAFNVDVPAGVTSVEATMDFVSLANGGEFSAGASATDKIAVLSWNWLTLYPKGWSSDQIQVRPALKLPEGWKWASALETTGDAGGQVQFAPVSLTTAVDSPVIMGAHLKKIPLQQGKTPAHELDIASDSEAALAIKPNQQQGFDNLVVEAAALFGARHYRHYNFLLSLSDHVAHFGLEHHESNDSRLGEKYLTDDSEWKQGAVLLPHEFVHSWNGKYRRPADLATPEYQTPMQSDLLWVYEGLTEYFGYVLTGRSGLWTPELYRDQMAILAMNYTNQPGRQWRSIEDTATAAQVLYGGSRGFENWRRTVDYYDEGSLVWLEADVLIRQQTGGKKSLDDFAQLFHGQPDSPPKVRPYTFDEVVNTLNQIAPYDWRKFFTDRILRVNSQPPLAGLEQGGWKLVYTDDPSELMRIAETRTGPNCTASLGILVDNQGTVRDSMMESIGYKAGLTPNVKIVAINGRRFTPALLRTALLEARNSKDPIQFIIENDEFFKTVSVDYHDGPRYPKLIRDSNRPDLLSEIIKAKATKPPTPEPQIVVQ